MNASLCLRRFGRDQAHQQRALARVLRRVHGDEVLVHRELVPVVVDDAAHVVTLERHREDGERPDDRVARREGLDVAVDVGGLVPARDRDDTVLRDRRHRALRTQVLEVRVGILPHRVVREEVDLVQLRRHGGRMTQIRSSTGRRNGANGT